MIHKYTYIFVDVEATLIRGKQYIIEIGAIKWMPNGTKENFSELVQPYKFKKLNSHIQKLTGITTEQLLKAPSFREVMAKFIKWSSGDTILITFGEFDRKVLEEELNRNHMDIQTIFPMIDYQQKYMIEHRLKEQPSLSSLLDKFQIEVTTKHRALADAISLFHIFQAGRGEELIQKQKTNEFGIILSELRQQEDSFDLVLTYISGNVKETSINIESVLKLNKPLKYDIQENEKMGEDGEVEIIQRTIIHPEKDVKVFLQQIIQNVQNKVLISLSGLKQFSRICRLHHCVIPKTEVMTLQNLIHNKDLSILKSHDLLDEGYPQYLVGKFETHIIEEFQKRDLFIRETVKI